MKPDFLPAARPISRLIEELNRLPGIGPKSAQRLAYHLLAAPPDMLVALRDAADAGDMTRVRGIVDALLAGWDG